MMNKLIKSFSLMAIAFIFVMIPMDAVLAVDAYDPNTPFVPCDGTDCSACDLVDMINTIILWLFMIVFLIFAIIMLAAGWGLVTSAGNQVALDAAKSKFTNAIIGIIIIMAAWLLIDVIMRGLLAGGDGQISGYGPWTQVQCQQQITALEWAGDPDTDPTVPPLAGPKPASCGGTDCQALDPSICKIATSCSISPDLAAKITAFDAAVKAAGVNGTRVTEAMPPTVNHQSQCHSNGTCIDYGASGGLSGADINKVADAARANGLRPVYEVKTQAEKNALVAQGASADNIKVISKITAPHFSVYGY